MPDNFEDRTSKGEFQKSAHHDKAQGKGSRMVQNDRPAPALTPDGQQRAQADREAYNQRLAEERERARQAQQELAEKRLAERAHRRGQGRGRGDDNGGRSR